MAKRQRKAAAKADVTVVEAIEAGMERGLEREQVQKDAPWAMPRDEEALWNWMREQLGISVPRQSVVEGHVAPFAYLCHSFFEPARVVGRTVALPRLGASSGIGAHEVGRDVVLWANRGGGKTFLGAVATLLDLVFKPGIEIRVLGGSREQSTRMFEHLRRLLDPAANPQLAALVDGRITADGVQLTNGARVEILAQSHTSIRGTRVQKLRCDEVELFKPDVWEAAQFTTRSKQCGGVFVHGAVECLSTMHLPFGLMHDLVQECRLGRRTLFKWGVVDVLEQCPPRYECERRDEKGAVQRCALHDDCKGRAKEVKAPGGHVYIADALAQKRRVALRAWKSEMVCEQPTREGAVIPEFDVKVHVRDFRVRSRHIEWEDGNVTVRRRVVRMLGGVDFGIRSPTVVLWVAEDEQGVMWVCDELIRTDSLLNDLAILVANGNAFACAQAGIEPWEVPEWLGVDPAGRARCLVARMSARDVLESHGLRVRATPLPIQTGIAVLSARFYPADGSGPRLFVHQRCGGLIESLLRYHYRNEDQSDLTAAKDGHDHAVDALRYLMVQVDGGVGLGQGGYVPRAGA